MDDNRSNYRSPGNEEHDPREVERIRAQLDKDIEEFFKRGGKIEQVPPDASTEKHYKPARFWEAE